MKKKIKKKLNFKIVPAKGKIDVDDDPLAGDMSEYIRNAKWFKFDEYFTFAPKNKTVTLRIGEQLLKDLKSLAKKEETNYQKLIRQAILEFLVRKAA